MSRGLIFWVLMLLWLLFGVLVFWPRGGGGAMAFAPLGGTLLQFVLFGLLGWQVFGPAVKG